MHRRKLNGPDDEDFVEWRRNHWVTSDHDVWIGHGVTVLPGASVGTGAVIGVDVDVSKNVAPYEIVGAGWGSPLRRRFIEPQGEALMQIAWWEWTHEAPATALPHIRALPTDAFIEEDRCRKPDFLPDSGLLMRRA